MKFHLVVTKPFQNFVRGDVITELMKIEEVLANDYKQFVTKVALIQTEEGQ